MTGFGRSLALATLLAVPVLAAPAPADAQEANVLPALNLPPATQASILAGAKACLGGTLGGDDSATRFAGWAPPTPEQRKNVRPEANVMVRDNVMIGYKAGKDGACMVLAYADPAFDPATFYPQLSALVGAKVAGGEPAKVDLPNGEFVVAMTVPKSTSTEPNVMLVFANRDGNLAKKGN